MPAAKNRSSRRMSISLSSNIFERLQQESDETGVSKTGIIAIALTQYFQARDLKPMLEQLQGIVASTQKPKK